MNKKIRFIAILAVEFIVVIVMILLIFFAGKKTYKVIFDINGGILISGSLEQNVTQGQSAIPPQVTKDGCFFLEWQGNYRRITKDVVIKAIWEYETTEGIEYNVIENSNYCTIKKCYKEVSGDVYIGAYYGEYKVLGIDEYAFAGCENIKNVYLLDGILNINKGAFEGCTNLESIIIPDTVIKIEDEVFKNCISLKKITIGNSVEKIGNDVLANSNLIEEIIIPKSVKKIGSNFIVNSATVVNCEIEELPISWDINWNSGNAKVNWGYVADEILDTKDDKKQKR